MMRRFLLTIIAGIIYFLGLCVSGAYADDLSYYQEDHDQVIYQDLDTMESSGNQGSAPQAPNNNQALVFSYRSDKQAAVQLPPQEEANHVDLSADHEAHLQVVNQDLDKMEALGNPVAVVPYVKRYKHDDLQFGSEIYGARYQQHSVERQKGFLSGYDARFTFRTSPKTPLINVYRVEGQWASGKFNNQTDDGTIHFDGIKDNTYEIRGLVGKDFYPSSYLRATGYSGFGYRYLEDAPQGLSAIVDNYRIEPYDTYSHYCYIPLGTDILYQTSRSYSVDSSFEFDYLVHGWEVSKLGIVPGYNTIVNDQNSGFGLRASLRLNLYFDKINAYAEGFFRYWNIGESNNVPDPTNASNPPLYVPKNSTEEFGLRLGLAI